MSGQKQDATGDYNFCYPIDLSKLQTDKLRLVPFDSNLPFFATLYASLTSTPAAVTNFDYLPYGPFQSADSFLGWYNGVIEPSNAVIWFAILVNQAGIEAIKKTKGDDETARIWEKDVQAGAVERGEFFAGSIGFLNADAAMASCEIGHINILPTFQRTFATTHANSLLLNYLLEPASSGCLQLRRVQWFANASNKRSVAAAERLGFRLEGVIRWHRVLPDAKLGEEADGDNRGPGRHSAVLSICWDDWRDGVREKVRGLMTR